MKNRPYYVPKGLSTTGYSGGSADEFDVFQNVDTDHGGFEGRGGFVRLAKIPDVRGILDFDGSNDIVSLVSAPLFSGTTWTLETLFQADSLSADRCILGRGSASNAGIGIFQLSTGVVFVGTIDSGANAVTMSTAVIPVSTVIALKLMRVGAALTLTVNGVTQTTTMHATNELATGSQALGADNTGTPLDGGIDFIRGFKNARTTQQDAYRRLQNPRNKDVVFDYVLTQGTASTPDVHDRSLFGLHASVAGGPTWARTPLSTSAPIQGAHYSTRLNGTREIVLMSAGRPYTAAVS